MTLKSFNVRVIYLINTFPEHSVFSPGRVKKKFERILIYLLYGGIIRDKVENFGQFEDKTLFGNESNLHTKIEFTYTISHYFSRSVFSVLAAQKLEI